MGITLILAIATGLLITGAFILNNHNHDYLALTSVLGAVITGVPCLICIVAIIITAISTPRELPSYQAQAAEYQALIDNPPSEDITFDALYGDIVEFNARVRQEQAKSGSFWHTGLYSSLWNEVPLVDLHID